jgi:nucleoside-diphosphate-sugar epimerase
MRILITGGGGYIGSDLVSKLLLEGHRVTVIDRMFFGDQALSHHFDNPNFELLRMDVRQIPEELFGRFEAVCDLVSLSNDPSGDLNLELTDEINHLSRARTAQLSKKYGVKRYLLWSTCSVYGSGVDRNLNEESPLMPLTAYSKASLNAERAVLPLADDSFAVTVLRNATVYGLSRRMRFDLVVNLMVATAFESGKITVTGGGKQWRPLVHLQDISRAASLILNTSPNLMNGQVFNIGMENVQISSLAYRIRDALRIPCEVILTEDDADKRDYHVSFSKIQREIGFSPLNTIESAVNEIYFALANGTCERNETTSTLKWYKRLIEAEELYKKFSIDERIL